MPHPDRQRPDREQWRAVGKHYTAGGGNVVNYSVQADSREKVEMMMDDASAREVGNGWIEWDEIQRCRLSYSGEGPLGHLPDWHVEEAFDAAV